MRKLRNMQETAQKIKNVQLDSYAMTLDEYWELREMIKDGNIFDAVFTAFAYGFVLGNRATVAGKITKKI